MSLRLYTFYTSEYLPLLTDWFLPSIKDFFEITIDMREQLPKTGKNIDDRDESWVKMAAMKVDTLIKATEENIKNKSVFIQSDVDVQFFGKVTEDILQDISENDFLFQKGVRNIHNGFFVCRANEKTLKFWKAARKLCVEKRLEDLQAAKLLLNLNLDYKDDNSDAYIRFSNPFGIKWRYLSPEKYINGRGFYESVDINQLAKPPKSTLVHHASGEVTLEGKIKQLRYVKNCLNK